MIRLLQLAEDDKTVLAKVIEDFRGVALRRIQQCKTCYEARDLEGCCRYLNSLMESSGSLGFIDLADSCESLGELSFDDGYQYKIVELETLSAHSVRLALDLLD